MTNRSSGSEAKSCYGVIWMRGGPLVPPGAVANGGGKYADRKSNVGYTPASGVDATRGNRGAVLRVYAHQMTGSPGGISREHDLRSSIIVKYNGQRVINN